MELLLKRTDRQKDAFELARSEWEPGLISSEPRPFSGIEEQMIKWCTFHMEPGMHMARTYRQVGSSEEEVLGVHSRTLEGKQMSAMYLLMATLGEIDGGILYVGFVKDYIDEAFQRVWDAYLTGGLH